MAKKYGFFLGGLLVLAALALAGCSQSWSGKELELEKNSVTLAKETERGGYKLITTPELKAWIDQKKPIRKRSGAATNS